MARNNIIHLVWPILLIYLLYLVSKLAWFDSLSSLANDSVNYLVMARHFSPWVTESDAVAAAWSLQDFPPFFPWLLAWTGTAHSFLYAHLLVAGLGLVSLYFFYLLSVQWLKNKNWAIFPFLIFSLSPGFILGLQGILSEPLYLMLVLIFLLIYSPIEEYSRNKIILLGFLLAAIMLTRTIGVTLCLALLAQAFFSSISKKKIQYQSIYLVLISLSIYLFLMLWGPEKDSHYSGILLDLLNTRQNSALETGTIMFNLQTSSLLESWSTFWTIYWTSDFSISHILVLTLLLFSLAGLFIRLAKNKYDSWYVLFYLMILIVWPHPGQMVRLLFPVMPMLLIYGAYSMKILLGKFANEKLRLFPAFFFMLLLAVILPSHAFIHSRAGIAAELQMIPVYEIFRRTDIDMAETDLFLQNQLLKDFKTAKNSIPKNSKVLYFLPSYLAILSDRQGVKTLSPILKRDYQRMAEESEAQFIFLTRLHPRKTRLGYSGFQGIEELQGWTNQLWCSEYINGGRASCLYQVQQSIP